MAKQSAVDTSLAGWTDEMVRAFGACGDPLRSRQLRHTFLVYRSTVSARLSTPPLTGLVEDLCFDAILHSDPVGKLSQVKVRILFDENWAWTWENAMPQNTQGALGLSEQPQVQDRLTVPVIYVHLYGGPEHATHLVNCLTRARAFEQQTVALSLEVLGAAEVCCGGRQALDYFSNSRLGVKNVRWSQVLDARPGGNADDYIL